jgi:SpoVK/Ycf46/Vps4 family AAA+-type ATPase
MANSDQIKAMIRSHSEGDDARFYAIAMQVAAQAAHSGHGRFAIELRELVDQAKANSKASQIGLGPGPIPMAQPRGELAGLLTVTYPKTRVADMSLEESLRLQIKRILLEQRQRERLRAHGYSPQRKLLLIGPPGTGKTLTSSALAGELTLALFTVQLDGLITKYLGETAAKLRLVFDAIRSVRGVYLFDEFDALGSERAASNDVGEIRRVLNSFLQFLDQDDSDSLVIGATNHVMLLDRAVFRRFDVVLEYHLPTPEIALSILQSRLGIFDTSKLAWHRVASETIGLSHSEITQACEQAAKNAILEHTTVISELELIGALEDRRKVHV